MPRVWQSTISSPSTASPPRWSFSKVSLLTNWLHRIALGRLLKNSNSKCTIIYTMISPLSTASPPRWNFSKVSSLPNRRYQKALGRLLRNSYSKCTIICTTWYPPHQQWARPRRISQKSDCCQIDYTKELYTDFWEIPTANWPYRSHSSMTTFAEYGVASVSRIDKITGLFCRI